MSKPIEAILKSFIRHVVQLQNEDDPAGSGFTREFRILREKQVEDRNNERFPMTEGKKDENIKKNRYKDILPRDDRRVKLKEIPGEAGSDYINASFIDDVNGRRGYIAAQGPMPHTVNDFWRMLWQYKTEIVFMACRLKEDVKAKCEKYWPEKGERMVFGDIEVHTESEEEIQDHFIKRQLRAEKRGEVHRLVQFQYVGWPDHNVPSSPDALRRMIEDVRNHRKRLDIPMVVHCSAGCGRTGTICAIDFAWTLLDKGMVSEGFSMFEVIKKLREQRMSMVQTPDQYEYTHMVMKSLCNEWLVSFAKNDYENVILGGARQEGVEEPEESYYNVQFHQDHSSARDSLNAGKRSSTESSTAVPSSKPVAGRKPDVKSSKPEITRPKPETSAQRPDMKPKPQAWKNEKITPASALYVNPSAPSEGGRHVAARHMSSPISGSGAPPLQEKTKPRHRDQHNFLAQEDSEVPKISKSGTAGRSAMRQKARPAAAQMSAGSQEVRRHGVEWQEKGGGAEEAAVYEVVDKSKKANAVVNAPLYENRVLYENHNLAPGNGGLLSDGNYANERMGGSEDHGAPALPSRHYKPEEITSAAKASSHPSAHADSHRHRYTNMLPDSPSPAASPNLPKGNVHWTQQSTPLTPPSPSPRSAQRGAPAISPRAARRQGQAVADSSSARDGGQLPSTAVSRPNVVQPRPGWMESSPSHSAAAKRDFPGIFSGVHTHTHGEPSRGHSAGTPQGLGIFQKVLTMARAGKEGQKHVVAAPGPSHDAEARRDRYVLERVPRVRGPRPHPSGWAAFSRNQRGHYL